MTERAEKRAEPTPERDCRPGTGRFECDENGLVVERFANGDCSFDIFDASEWPGGDEDGNFYARLIADTAAERDRLLVANAELVEALEALLKQAVWDCRETYAVELARAVLAKAKEPGS
jgi:hypothetical protein